VKVALRDMPCHRRVELSPAFVAEAVSGLAMRAALERPDDDPNAGGGAAEFDFYVEDANVFARGQLGGWVEVACSRCVGPVRVEIDEPLAVTFMPAGRLPDAEPAEEAEAEEEEPKVDADDIDLFPYHGEEIDLAPLLREQVILAVPFAPLCSESCRGLCPVCGIDRNTGSCTCDPTPADPRWSALKNLKP
jgi:uncharacterized protein